MALARHNPLAWKWLRRRRERANVTLKTVAVALAYSSAYLSDIELGRRPVPLRVADYYRSL